MIDKIKKLRKLGVGYTFATGVSILMAAITTFVISLVKFDETENIKWVTLVSLVVIVFYAWNLRKMWKKLL